ncbi:hypothetical protein FACS1894151_04990 [Spirochaetia bacterium]|nr:hypothetical protein FACS1894151_04990 [Spirochaetia bacterium]
MTVYNKKGKSLEINIRLARPDEAPELIELLKKQYGSYYGGEMYDKEFVRKSIQSGTLQVIVAELPGGLIAGMIGADAGNVFSGSMVIVMLVIKPELRGFGMSKILQGQLLKMIPQNTYTCIYGHCRTLDTISQTNHIEFGYRMTGLLLNTYINDSNAEYVAGLPLPFKEVLLVACLPRTKKDAGMLYALPAYAAYITEVYESLGVVYMLSAEKTRLKAPQSVLFVNQDEQQRYCEIIIKTAGLDLINQIETILGQYAAPDQTFNIFINLNDPGCGNVCRLLEERGFFFTGIHPLSGPYEYVIMHYSPSLPVNFEEVAIVSEFIEQFNYIEIKYKEAQLVRQR